MTTIAFVCRGNAARSQLAGALAEREAEQRHADVAIRTGGTDPKEAVSPEVVAVIRESGVAEWNREPREITDDDLAAADYVVTMGCAIEDRLPADWDGEHREWTLDNTAGDAEGSYRPIRDELSGHVRGLFDELESNGELRADVE